MCAIQVSEEQNCRLCYVTSGQLLFFQTGLGAPFFEVTMSVRQM